MIDLDQNDDVLAELAVASAVAPLIDAYGIVEQSLKHRSDVASELAMTKASIRSLKQKLISRFLARDAEQAQRAKEAVQAQERIDNRRLQTTIDNLLKECR